MRQASEYQDAQGKIHVEYARAPKKTPLWLLVDGLGVDESGKIVGVGVSESFSDKVAPIVEVQLQLEKSEWESPASFQMREDNARRTLLGSNRWQRKNLAGVLLLHEKSIVSWYDVNMGPIRWATLGDLTTLEQGQAWPDEIVEALAFDEEEAGYEDRTTYIRGFKGKKLWLLSEKQFDEAQFPPPIMWGPPFINGVTVDDWK